MIQTITQTHNSALMPDPTLNLYQWGKDNFNVPKGSPISGLVDFTLTPYLPQMLKWLSWDDLLQQLDVIKGTQLGLTLAGDILIAGNIEMTPCNILMIHGSDGDAREYASTRFESILEENENLNKLVYDKYDKLNNSNKTLKGYPNGTTIFKGGKVAKNYRRFSAKIGMIDDCDNLDLDIGATKTQKGEGSPIKLLKARTDAQMGIYKLFIQGSPKTEHNSVIWSTYKDTNKMLFMVPCIKCGKRLYLDFFKIIFKYEKSTYQLDYSQPVYIECEQCHTRMYEKDKFKMENKGVFEETVKKTNSKFHKGVMLPSTYSLMGLTWLNMVEEFLAAKIKQKKGDDSEMITFFNTKLALPWKQKSGVRIKYSTLYKQRESYTEVPEHAAIIAAGGDIQDNRIEVTVYAYSENGHRYGLEHTIIGGDTSIPHTSPGSPYLKLEEFLKTTYNNEHGCEQPIIVTALDLGYMSKVASPFIEYLQNKGVLIHGVFGKQNDHKIFVKQTTTINKYSLPMYQVNVNIGKNITYNQLKMEPGKTFIHFNEHASFTEKFFGQLTIERPVMMADKNGHKKRVWYKPEHAKNEPFDTTNYSLAALDILDIPDEYGNTIDWGDYMEWNKLGCVLQDTDNTGFNILDPGEEI